MFAQEVRGDTLRAVEVSATRYDLPAIEQPVQMLAITERQLRLTAARDLTGLLSLHGLGHIRSYGPGMAGGMSQRGFGASSFQVLRDGFALNNPMLGQADLSLIPVSQISSAEVATGNASSAFGSAANGGSLVLRSGWQEGWALGHERGSAGFVSSHGYLSHSLKGWRLTGEGGATAADNDFLYYDPLDERDERRVNNHFSQRWARLGGVGQAWGLGVQSNLYWGSTDRRIPNSILTGDGKARQRDHDLRLTAMVTPSSPARWTASTQLYQNVLRYHNPILQEDSYNRVRGAAVTTEFRLVETRPFDLDAVLGGDLAVASTNNYNGSPHRWSGNGTLKAIWEPQRGTKLYPAVRADAIGGVGVALSPSLGVNQAVVPGRLHLRGQASYNFTAPTLNDLYWSSGGNPDLLPERAAKADLGFHLSSKPGVLSGELQAGVYAAKLTDGILWQPGAANIWTPVNVQNMASRGLEAQFNAGWDFGFAEWFASGSLVHTRAYVSRPRFEGDAAVGKQLRYSPEWMARAQSGFAGPGFELAAEWVRNGDRYITEDHSSPLEPLSAYSLFNATARFWAKLGPLRPEFKITASNVTDIRYDSMAWYPMPGRQWMFGLVLRS